MFRRPLLVTSGRETRPYQGHCKDRSIGRKTDRPRKKRAVMMRVAGGRGALSGVFARVVARVGLARDLVAGRCFFARVLAGIALLRVVAPRVTFLAAATFLELRSLKIAAVGSGVSAAAGEDGDECER